MIPSFSVILSSGKWELPNEVMASSDSKEGKPLFHVNEATTILESMSLTSFLFRDYLIVMRSDFDVTISDEPYIALTLLYNTKSGRFMARMWNKTVNVGNTTSLEEFEDACKRHFRGRRLCLGCPESEEEEQTHSFLLSQTPIPRKIARHGVFERRIG